jgi:hypothetical protein
MPEIHCWHNQCQVCPGPDTELGKELGNLMTEKHGLDADRESHPKLLLLTE